MRRLVSILALATLALPLAAQTPAPLRIDALMSERDRQETGVTRLTAAERQAFERWLARYTAAAVAGATRAVDETAATARRTPERTPDRGHTTARRVRRVALGATVEITSVLANGGFLVMEDGTMWEVHVRDITSSTTWTAGDQVLVLDNPAPPDRLYRLRFENGRARSTASVRYAGRAGGKGASDSARAVGMTEETIFRTGAASSIAAFLPIVVPVSAGGVHARREVGGFPVVSGRREPGTLGDGGRRHTVAEPPARTIGVRAPAVAPPSRSAAATRR